MAEDSNKTRKRIALFLSTYQSSTASQTANNAEAAKSGLDEPTQNVLQYIHAMPPAYHFEPKEARKYRLTAFEHPDTDSVAKEDMQIPCDNYQLDARIYRPAHKSNGERPALIYFHGGGFVLGGIESHDKMLAQLCAQSDVDIISVAYRLAPETTFPGAVEDAQRAIHWIMENAQALNIDSNRIAVGGDSAGANLATGYCIVHKDDEGVKPCLQLLIYPSTIGNDTSPSREQFSEKLLLTKSLLKWFHANYISKEDEHDPRFNLMKFEDLRNCPPVFMITGGFDPLRDEGQMFAQKLRLNGITVKHICYTDMFHGFINFGSLQQSQDAVTECATVLNKALHHTTA